MPHATANSWPLLVLAGASEMHNLGKMAFQEMDQVSLVAPHAKMAIRPAYFEQIPRLIRDAYRTSLFGRPGPTYVDLPANYIMGHYDGIVSPPGLQPIVEIPVPAAPAFKIKRVVDAFKQAKAPLVVIGKGAAYGRAERSIQRLIDEYVGSMVLIGTY